MSAPAGIAVTLPIVYPYRVDLQINWPDKVRHGRHDFLKTGKQFTCSATNLPAAEYRHVARARGDGPLEEKTLWLICDGTILPR